MIAKWKTKKHKLGVYNVCSACGLALADIIGFDTDTAEYYVWRTSKYCPECGAEMGTDEEDTDIV